MADFTSVIALKMSGTIGDKTIRTLPSGKMSMSQKAANPTFKDKEVEESRDLRIKGFGGSGHIAPLVADVIRIGLPPRKRGESSRSRFMHENAKTLCDAVRDEQGELKRVYDYPEMVIAVGSIKPVTVTVTVTAETGKIVFEQTADTAPDGATRNAKDQVYGYVFDGTNEEGELVKLRARSEGGSTSFDIPAGWDKANLFVYTLVKFHKDEKVSRSKCIYPAPAVRDPLVNVKAWNESIPATRDTPARGVTKVNIVKTAQKRETPNISPRDQVYAMLIDTANDRAVLCPLGERGKREDIMAELPDDWNMADLLVYTFAVMHDLSRVSTPRCLNAPGGIDFPGVAANYTGKKLNFTVAKAGAGEKAGTTEGTKAKAGAAAGANDDSNDSRLYAVVFDARESTISLVPLHNADAGTPLTFTPDAKSSKRFSFACVIAVDDEDRSEAKLLEI